MVLMSMLKAPGVFAAGVAGAPVVDWRLYDTHYTERYMGHPEEGNFYEKSSPATYAQALTDKLLVIHGMADDNVFFDNSIKLITALQKANKQFELMTYPGKRHRITGEAEEAHLGRLQVAFFNRHLKPGRHDQN